MAFANFTGCFRPLSRQIGIYTLCTQAGEQRLERSSFRPLQRQIGIYTMKTTIKLGLTDRFRPLSRQIGIYTNRKIKESPKGFGGVSVPSRGRQVSIRKMKSILVRKIRRFPSPLEVDRELYQTQDVIFPTEQLFPAPDEVDRKLYTKSTLSVVQKSQCFRPLSRQIGIYTMNIICNVIITEMLSFRPLSRQIGIYTVTEANPYNDGDCFRPLSRQIGIYTFSYKRRKHMGVDTKFPSPLEVDRYLYGNRKKEFV